MKQVGIFYGSSTGDTEKVAALMQEKIGLEKVALHDIFESKSEDLKKYPFLILGISTWGIGQIQDDWKVFLPELKNDIFNGQKIALFGLGDQESYPDTFADALGILYDELKNLGFESLGKWPVDGYEYLNSLAVRDGKFVGLVLDERNQPELTEERVVLWLKSIGF